MDSRIKPGWGSDGNGGPPFSAPLQAAIRALVTAKEKALPVRHILSILFSSCFLLMIAVSQLKKSNRVGGIFPKTKN